MNFNYKKLYKKIFPSKNVITVSIIFLILLLIFLFFQIVIALKFFDKIESNEKNDSKTSNEETEVAINNEVKDEIDQQKLNDNNQKEEAKTNKEKKNTSPVIAKNEESQIKQFKYFLIGELILFLLFITFNLWIMFSAIMRYSNINKNFRALRGIKLDEFISNSIAEFIEICSQKTSLYYATIIVSSIAMLFQLIGIIFFIISFC